MSYDEIISSLGEFGRYQRFVLFLICLITMVCAIHAVSIVFLFAQPNFRCALSMGNITDTNTSNFELPAEIWESRYSKETPCEFYTDANKSVTCSSYIYDKSVYPNSAVTEWHLVCERSWLIGLQQTLFMFGLLLGSIIFGQLSDKFGRKPILLLALGMQLISGIFAGLASNFICFTIARMFLGATVSGAYVVTFVLTMEMLGPRYRLLASTLIGASYSIGALLATGYAFIIRDWRTLQIVMTLTGLLFLAYPWLVPESTRWLMVTNQKEKALASIKKIVRFNKVKITIETMETLLMDLDEKKSDAMTATPTVLDLFRSPNMRCKTLLIFFDWFVIVTIAYGITWNMNVMGDNLFLNFAICAMLEIPSCFVVMLLIEHWGRRPVLCGSMAFTGIVLILTMAPTSEMNWLFTTLIILGKFGITTALGTIYIFSTEQFPTVVRNVGLGAASMISRIGGMLMPFLFATSQIWRPMPLVICGMLAFMGGTLTLLLPETLNKPTLETLEDGEKFRRKVKNTQLQCNLNR